MSVKCPVVRTQCTQYIRVHGPSGWPGTVLFPNQSPHPQSTLDTTCRLIYMYILCMYPYLGLCMYSITCGSSMSVFWQSKVCVAYSYRTQLYVFVVGEYERVQKKAFTNWINSHLIKVCLSTSLWLPSLPPSLPPPSLPSLPPSLSPTLSPSHQPFPAPRPINGVINSDKCNEYPDTLFSQWHFEVSFGC